VRETIEREVKLEPGEAFVLSELAGPELETRVFTSTYYPAERPWVIFSQDVESRLPAGTITFLFTDVAGSTRLLQDLGDDYAGVLAEHRRVLRAAIARYGGVEVDTQGDSFFVAFAKATDAVAAASAVRDELAGCAASTTCATPTPPSRFARACRCSRSRGSWARASR
jgi:class 3 adenylate cyclase